MNVFRYWSPHREVKRLLPYKDWPYEPDLLPGMKCRGNHDVQCEVYCKYTSGKFKVMGETLLYCAMTKDGVFYVCSETDAFSIELPLSKDVFTTLRGALRMGVLDG